MLTNYAKISVPFVDPRSGHTRTLPLLFFFDERTAPSVASVVAECEANLDRSEGEPSVAVYRHHPAFRAARCVGGCELCDPGRDERREHEPEAA